MITVVGRLIPKIKRYTVVCTDKRCLAVLELESTDIKKVSRFSVARDGDEHIGIFCPVCNQILDQSLFREIT